jgi:Fe-S-cluster containining protein
MSDMWKYFKCQQCGACCKEIGLPYDAESFFKMKELFNMSGEEVIEKYYGKVSPDGSSWESDDNKRTPCPFLKSNNGKCFCDIYSIRPYGCRLYPIDSDFGRDGVACPAWEIAFSKLKKEQEEGI